MNRKDEEESSISDSVCLLAERFTSPNEMDRNFEPANVVDGLFAIARAIQKLASAIEKATDKP